MRKILIFLFLTAPLTWAGPKVQKSLLNNPSETREIETLNDPQNSGGFEYIGKESQSFEENPSKTANGHQAHVVGSSSGGKYYTPLNEPSTYSPWSSKESEKKELETRSKHPEIMEPYTIVNTHELDKILERKVEERFRGIQNQTSSVPKPPKKDPSIVDDAIYAAKTGMKEAEAKKIMEKKEQEDAPPAGARGVIKKVVLYGALVALGFGANEFKNQVFPKETDNGELAPLINQMNNCTLNTMTTSEETSWFGQIVAPLNHATTHVTALLGSSWNTLWGRTEEAQKEISSNVNHLPETEKLSQKGLSSKTETEL